MLNPNDTNISTNQNFYQLSTAVAELGLAQPQLVFNLFFHFPRGSSFTLPEEGSRCNLHPEAASKREDPSSIRVSSLRDVTAGLTSSV